MDGLNRQTPVLLISTLLCLEGQSLTIDNSEDSLSLELRLRIFGKEKIALGPDKVELLTLLTKESSSRECLNLIFPFAGIDRPQSHAV